MHSTDAPSPRITHLAWGTMQVDGLGTEKDVKLWPGGGRAWDWNETGTRHVPGIQPADVEELLDHGSAVIVLSRGMQKRLRTAPETRTYLDEQGIPYHIKETKEAAALYNDLAERGERVGGLFHSTC